MADPLTILGQPVSPDAFAETLPMWVHWNDYVTVVVYADGWGSV